MADYEALWHAAALALLPTGRQPDLAKPSELFAHSVILKADSSSGFAASYKWQGAKPLAGSPHMAEVSRLKAGHFPCDHASRRMRRHRESGPFTRPC